MNNISVIVPMYKTEKYLKKCVDSILNQSYTNLEIVLVDDGSPDNCPEICDNYAEADKRIRVIHKSNGGISDARNAGLNAATGTYVMFVDSDDFVDSTIVARLFESLTQTKSDIAICKYTEISESDEQQLNAVVETVPAVFTSEDALLNMLYQADFTHSPWAKLYDIKLFDDIRYPVGHKYEDLATTYKLISKAKRVVINNFKGYYYVQRNDSIMSSKFDREKLDTLVFAQQQLDFVIKNHPAITQAAEYRILVEAVDILVAMRSAGADYDDVKVPCMAVIRKYRWSVLLRSWARRKAFVYASLSILRIDALLFMLTRRMNSKRQTA